ncbi:MAG: LamG-like jellyroll fold domain-containing protein, partial [Candidatus Neomarinimicrobiota bacterium]
MKSVLSRLMTPFVLFAAISSAQQITVDHVEQMPNLPNPYLMRDWKQVTRGYDSLVFDLTRTGEYLPLIWINTNTINYPNHDSFGLHTVVGTSSPSNAEAINVLPAVIGASLVGIDKSNQNGTNWVLGCEEFFNRRPEENVYLNGATAQSGEDWWYSVMPNVFFYQLYDLYPGTGDFDYQFTSVADQWLRAVVAMGGSAAPWKKAEMNYRGWYLATMTPHTSGVKESEAAGSIAWILYNAYVKTGDPRYRQGAEWALEFLSEFTINPAYELQLPYGVYAAARMNAELGTNYNVDKMLNWCFETDNSRQWGVTLGNWGGYDSYGLVGEAQNTGYAFTMNGYEMAGALVPMVRYDDRYAHAIGKWVLNMANASRLFYTNYLPDENQDGETWSHQYDPLSYIAHESLREFAQYTGVSPYATGDGWGATNFALYGSSHVGILGGIIDTTNVEGILQLDLLKTDYFHEQAYPSYLFYNPYDGDTLVTFDVGSGTVDIYDAVNNEFILSGASGITMISIPADEAIIAVLIPAGGTPAYDHHKMLVNEIVVDYTSGQTVTNHSPRIKAVAVDSATIVFNQTVTIYCTAFDYDSDPLHYTWTVGTETIGSDTSTIIWTAPGEEGIYTIVCTVSDGAAESVKDSLQISVVESINHPPVIDALSATAPKIDLGDTTYVTCLASDPDNDVLKYTWSSESGILGAGDTSVSWIAPNAAGYYYIICTVADNRGGEASDSVGILVRDLSDPGTGDPVAFFPFNGNADDNSGMTNHGSVNGAELTEDRYGNPNSAYHFNGTSDHIRVPVSSSLNFQDAITVNFWMKAEKLYSRESYPISHGNWDNRWKISINNDPDRRIRWTVKTTTGIKDLDSQVRVELDSYYHIVGTYDGSDFDLYINGILDAHSTF